jgi:hypothetical protein
MCVFCAAIPITMAIGAKAETSQREKAKDALARGEKPPKRLVPVGPVTAVVVSGLVIASVVYHTHFIGPL